MLTEFVIDRKRWLRGGRAHSGLLIDDKMCCLGFAGIACGARPEMICDRTSPRMALVVEWPAWMLEKGGNGNSNDAKELMRINDSEATSDAEKEAQIVAIFAKHGVTVRFVDEAPDALEGK